MKMERRSFLRAASVSTAGLLMSRVAPMRAAEEASADAQTPSTASTSLDLTIWGSCLYAFSWSRASTSGGRQLDLAFFGAGADGAAGHTVPHEPQMVFANGTIRVTGDLDVRDGVWYLPPGKIVLAPSSLAADASELKPDLDDQATFCPAPPAPGAPVAYELNGLAYLPRLRTTSLVGDQWRERTLTRIALTRGTLTAAPPLKGPADCVQAELRGPGSEVTTQVITDTTRYAVPLRATTVTFICERGTLTVERIGAARPLQAVLQSGPSLAGTPPLTAGMKAPHFHALYAPFDPPPAEAARAELFVSAFCWPEDLRRGRAASLRRGSNGGVSGASPGDLCPPGLIVLDAEGDGA